LEKFLVSETMRNMFAETKKENETLKTVRLPVHSDLGIERTTPLSS